MAREWLQELNIPQDRVVLELSELQPFDNSGVTPEAVRPYQDSGFCSAIDDLGVRYLGKLISRHACAPDTFVGHIGGDDFIVIFRNTDWHRICEDILREFEQGLTEFYDPQHILDGGIWAEDRHGQRQF